jgi:hypothetical protein
VVANPALLLHLVGPEPKLIMIMVKLTVPDRETKTHRRGQAKRSYGHCRRCTEIPEAEPPPNTPDLDDPG